MRCLPILLLAAMVVSVPAAGEERISGTSLSVGLTVPSPVTCGPAACLRIVEGHYHAATIPGAAPSTTDRQACAAGFAALVADMSKGQPIGRQSLYKARRCRSLGLAPVIVPG